MSDLTLRQSPLVALSEKGLFHWAGKTVSLQESPFMGHIRIRGDRDNPLFTERVEQVTSLRLPSKCGETSQGKDMKLIWLSPDEWLLALPDECEVGALIDRLKVSIGSEHVALIDISGGQTVIRVSGVGAVSLLSSGTTLDLHQGHFLGDDSAQTLLFGATVLIVRVNHEGAVPQFEIYCRRSFADDLAKRLIDAARLIK